jgi:hypothetical protein
MKTEQLKTEPKKALKSLKHTYTPEERQALGEEMAQQVNALRAIDSEFEQVKAQYKSRTALAEAIMGKCAAAITSGFEFRDTPCVLVIDAKRRRRLWFVSRDGEYTDSSAIAKWGSLDWEREAAQAAIIEDLRPEDFQQELPIAEKGGAK